MRHSELLNHCRQSEMANISRSVKPSVVARIFNISILTTAHLIRAMKLVVLRELLLLIILVGGPVLNDDRDHS